MFQLFLSPKRFPSPLLFSVSHICPPLTLGRFFCHPLCPSNDFQMCLLLASLSPFLPLFLIQLFLILSPFSFLCSTMSKQLVLLFDSQSDVHVGLRSQFLLTAFSTLTSLISHKSFGANSCIVFLFQSSFFCQLFAKYIGEQIFRVTIAVINVTLVLKCFWQSQRHIKHLISVPHNYGY